MVLSLVMNVEFNILETCTDKMVFENKNFKCLGSDGIEHYCVASIDPAGPMVPISDNIGYKRISSYDKLNVIGPTLLRDGNLTWNMRCGKAVVPKLFSVLQSVCAR